MGEECNACQTLGPDIRTFGLMAMTSDYGAIGRRFETWWNHNSNMKMERSDRLTGYVLPAPHVIRIDLTNTVIIP